MASALAANSSPGDGQAADEGRAHGAVTSHDGVRLWRKASMPSAASAPANSSAERVRATASPSDHGASESSASSALVAATAPGAALEDARRPRRRPRRRAPARRRPRR